MCLCVSGYTHIEKMNHNNWKKKNDIQIIIFKITSSINKQMKMYSSWYYYTLHLHSHAVNGGQFHQPCLEDEKRQYAQSECSVGRALILNYGQIRCWFLLWQIRLIGTFQLASCGMNGG